VFSSVQPRVVYFSGKVPNSIYSYLARKNVDFEGFFELSDLPAELLRDPTCWLDAKQVETFLASVEREFGGISTEHSLITDVGLQCHELRSWGVLDSVLKMMSDPQDIFGQPQRILSYFISPAPPVANVQRTSESISFDLPLAPEEYPYFSEYLKAAFEGLPQYASKEMALVGWTQTRMQINWDRSQASLFESERADVNMKPEFMRALLKTLEDSQIELEQQKKHSLVKEKEVNLLKAKLLELEIAHKRGAELSLTDGQAELIKSQCFRLIDYLGRAQQLVTLLVKQDRMDRQVQEAMRRVDWQKVMASIPEIRESLAAKVPSSTQVNEHKPLTIESEQSIELTPPN